MEVATVASLLDDETGSHDGARTTSLLVMRLKVQ
jgi:hypothetical protein